MVFVCVVVEDSAVDSGGAYADAFFPLFFAILLNKAKFFRVNRVRFGRCSPSCSLSLSLSLSIGRFRNNVAGETCSSHSTLGTGSEVYG